MIILCPNCATQFAVPDHAIPPSGRRVRCSRCGNEWVQTLEDAEGQAEIQDVLSRLHADETLDESPEADPETHEDFTRPLRGISQLPAVPREREHTGGRKLAFFTLLLLACAIALVRYRDRLPMLGSLYNAIGMTETRGLAFENMKFTRKPSGGTFELAVEGDVVNRGKQLMLVPPVKITLYTQSGHEIGTLQYPAPGSPLKPGEKLHIQPEITNVSPSAVRMVLDIGKSWETALRPVPDGK